MDFPKLARIKQDDENMEKLHCAARKGQTEHVRRLIHGSGIDPSIQNKFGCTALHLACKYGQLGCVRELAGQVDLSIAWHGKRPLQLAVESNNQEVLQVMMATIKEQGKDVAAFINECDDYEQMVDHSKFKMPPKHVHGQTVLHYCVSTRNVPMLKVLLALGGTPNAKDRGGETVLMRAVEVGADEEFELLLQAPDVRIDGADRNGRTSLCFALAHDRPDMARKLLEMGADVNMEDQDKNNAITLAMTGGFYSLLEAMLPLADPFAIQSAPFHNGVSVLPERLQWAPFVTDEAVKSETIKVLQKKLDQMREKDKPNDDGSPKKKKKKA